MKGKKVDYDEFNKMIDYYMDNGFRYFDTAHGYIDGLSEKAIGDCLSSRYPRESFELTDKLTSSYFKKEEDWSPHGVFNTILGWFGIAPLQWLSDQSSAMPSIVLFATWSAAGGTIIVYLAALVGVAPELYDAAEVDGAGVWRKVWHVTMPQLRGVLLVTFILQIIGTAQVFLEPFLLTGGGPANSTTTVLMLIYRYAFQSSLGGDYGAATALSLMLAAVLAIFSIIYFRITKSWSTS